MSTSPKLKIILGLVIVFVAGVSVGCWVHSKYTERIFMRVVDNRTWAPAVLKDIDKELNLTAEQREKAKVLLDESVREITRDFSRMGEEFVRLHVRMQSILTPEQQEKNGKSFAALKRELERKFQITLPPESNFEKGSSSRTNLSAMPIPMEHRLKP